MTQSFRETHTADDPTGLLIPVLPIEDGPPDAATVEAWHLALSNLLSAEVQHDLLALWLFPAAGGVILLAPTELTADHLVVPAPTPRLAQHQLYELEERIRRAGYGSAIAVPIRGESSDAGLALFAALQPGVYGVSQALRLHTVLRDLVPTFEGLGVSPPLPKVSAGGSAPEDLLTVVAECAVEAGTGPEFIRLLSGSLFSVLPHERIEIAVASASGTWALLSGRAEGQRWTSPGAAAQVTGAVEGLLASADDDGVLMFPEFGPGTSWPSYSVTRTSRRVRSIIGVRLTVAGSPSAWLLVGGPRAGMFGDSDRETLKLIAPIVALRVQGLRQALTSEVGQAQLSTLQASQPRVARLVTLLAATNHWGEASSTFAEEACKTLGYRSVRFALRLGSDRLIQVDPGDPRPLTALEPSVQDFSAIGSVVAGRAPFLVYGEEGENLAVPLRLAGRAMGALEFLGGALGAAGHPVTDAQQFADVLAPHLELLRRSALPDPAALVARPSPAPAIPHEDSARRRS